MSNLRILASVKNCVWAYKRECKCDFSYSRLVPRSAGVIAERGIVLYGNKMFVRNLNAFRIPPTHKTPNCGPAIHKG